MNPKRLDETEVRKRLLYERNPAVTEELYDFGLLLLREAAEDNRRLDTKAAALAGYAGAVVTVLLSSVSLWRNLLSPVSTLFVFVAGLAAIIAVVVGVRAMALRYFDWFSADEWLPVGCLNDAERLKRYRIVTVWGHLNSHKDAYSEKAGLVLREQRALALTGSLLLVAFILALWGNLPRFPLVSEVFTLPDFLNWLRVAWWQFFTRIIAGVI